MPVHIIGLLGLMVFAGCLCIYEAWLLASGRNVRALRIYKISGSQRAPLVAKEHAVLLSVQGAWFFVLSAAVTAWDIPIAAWAGLVALGSAIFLLGKAIVERRNGLRDS